MSKDDVENLTIEEKVAAARQQSVAVAGQIFDDIQELMEDPQVPSWVLASALAIVCGAVLGHVGLSQNLQLGINAMKEVITTNAKRIMAQRAAP